MVMFACDVPRFRSIPVGIRKKETGGKRKQDDRQEGRGIGKTSGTKTEAGNLGSGSQDTKGKEDCNTRERKWGLERRMRQSNWADTELEKKGELKNEAGQLGRQGEKQ